MHFHTVSSMCNMRMNIDFIIFPKDFTHYILIQGLRDD